jgi:hypothetical protein
MLKLSMSKVSLFKLLGSNLVRTFRFKPGARSLLGANGQPGSVAIGNILMLLAKPPTTQGGNVKVFHIWTLPKWASGSKPDEPVRVVSPEVPPRQRRCKEV